MRRTPLQPAEPHESKIKQPPAGASRRRRPPPRSCSPAPIPRRNDARRDALSGDSRRTLPAGCCSPVRGGRRRAASRQRPHPWPSPLGSNAWRESSTESSALVLDLRGARAPLFHWYVRRRLPFDGQLRQNVVETDVRSPRRSCSPDKASRA